MTGKLPVSMLLLALAASGCSDPVTTPLRRTPNDARVVVEDIPRFWEAFDQITSAIDTMPIRRDYLDRGTAGLTDFTKARWKNAATLTAAVWQRHAYYQSIRQTTLGVQSLVPEVRAAFVKLADMYDAAVFPDVYFEIGAMSTGGTVGASGLLIGTELFSRTETTPVALLSPWEQYVTRGPDILPSVVAHELTHYQQKYAPATTLLAQSIREGSADFVGKLLTGHTINEGSTAYGVAHEAELWAEFKTVMHGTDISRWLYNGGNVTGPNERPADLGYFVGARITEEYYLAAADKKQALIDILNIKDFDAFLAKSFYDGRSR